VGDGLVGGGDAAAEVLGDAQGLGGCFVHAQDVTKLQWGKGWGVRTSVLSAMR